MCGPRFGRVRSLSQRRNTCGLSLPLHAGSAGSHVGAGFKPAHRGNRRSTYKRPGRAKSLINCLVGKKRKARLTHLTASVELFMEGKNRIPPNGIEIASSDESNRGVLRPSAYETFLYRTSYYTRPHPGGKPERLRGYSAVQKRSQFNESKIKVKDILVFKWQLPTLRSSHSPVTSRTTTFFEFQAPATGVLLAAWTWIVSAYPREFYSIRLNDIIDRLDGRCSEGHPRLTIDVRNGEISLCNDVHPNDRSKITSDIRAFCNEYSCHADFVWQNEVSQIGAGLTASTGMIDRCSADRHQTQGIRGGFGDNTSGCSGIP